MTDTAVALVLPETGEIGLLEQDGRAARDYARESLSPATRRKSSAILLLSLPKGRVSVGRR